MDVMHQSQQPCGDCSYFQAQEKGIGTCHRFPPTFAGESAAKEIHHWRFPLVTPHHWCGEFRMRIASRGAAKPMTVVAK